MTNMTSLTGLQRAIFCNLTKWTPSWSTCYGKIYYSSYKPKLLLQAVLSYLASLGYEQWLQGTSLCSSIGGRSTSHPEKAALKVANCAFPMGATLPTVLIIDFKKMWHTSCKPYLISCQLLWFDVTLSEQSECADPPMMIIVSCIICKHYLNPSWTGIVCDMLWYQCTF